MADAAAESRAHEACTRCLIEEELATGALVVAHAARVLAKKGYYLCYPEQKAHLPALQTFRKWVMEGVDVVA